MQAMRRIFRLTLIAALMLCIVLSTANAADTTDYTFDLNGAGDGYIVTGYTGGGTSITVPDWYAGKPVTEIGDGAFQGNTTISSVSLPSTITVIGAAAFKNCSSLTTMTTYTAASESPEEPRTPGDADGSGKVDVYDAVLVLKQGAGWNIGLDMANADVNGSGSVDIFDALLILQYSAGADVTLQ